MPRDTGAASKGPIQVAFHSTKYGPELLIDAAFVRQMPAQVADRLGKRRA